VGGVPPVGTVVGLGLVVLHLERWSSPLTALLPKPIAKAPGSPIPSPIALPHSEGLIMKIY